MLLMAIISIFPSLEVTLLTLFVGLVAFLLIYWPLFKNVNK